jgi:magnesium-transporting ATPase (P-type)
MGPDTAICPDKTGTLPWNEMHVESVVVRGGATSDDSLSDLETGRDSGITDHEMDRQHATD